jgi:hypothetical protein
LQALVSALREHFKAMSAVANSRHAVRRIYVDLRTDFGRTILQRLEIRFPRMYHQQ